jgi:ribonuclease HI
MDLVINTDGASRGNPGHGAAAWVIKDSAGKIQEICGKYLGVVTNNEAEYQALIGAFNHILSLSSNIRVYPLEIRVDPNLNEKLEIITVKSDSLLMVSQLTGKWKIKDRNLQLKVMEVKNLERELGCKINYQHIPRELNSEADAEANRVLDEQHQ